MSNTLLIEKTRDILDTLRKQMDKSYYELIDILDYNVQNKKMKVMNNFSEFMFYNFQYLKGDRKSQDQYIEIFKYTKNHNL